ncbi:hypothetical protein JCM6882_005521 [Rhodosporidiobolus microsporus]
MLVHLAPNDAAHADVLMVPAFIFALPPSEDGAQLVKNLEQAVHRVVQKWRLLGGTPRKLESGTWAIDIPDGDELSGGFTTEKLSVPYHEAAGLSAPLPLLSSRPSGVLPPFKMSLFRPSSAPSRFADYAAQNAPVLHVHAALCTDALVVGISLSHGVFGGTGIGMVLRALSAELHGTEWTPPPLSAGENPFVEALDRLEADPAVQGVPEAEAITDWESATEDALGRFTSSATYEAVKGENEARWVFVRQETVDKLVKRVKEEVKAETGGKEYVSTGDVLFAWLLKAAHSSDSRTSPDDLVSVAALYHSTSLLSPRAPILANYPLNAAIPYSLLPSTSFSALATTPLSTLGLQLHRQVDKYRSLPALKTAWQQIKTAASSVGGILLPTRDWAPGESPETATATKGPYTTRWLASNQLSVGLADFSLPSSSSSSASTEDLPLLAFYLASEAPGVLDHVLPLQQLPGAAGGGVAMSATMRRGRWAALERAVEELERGEV